MGECVLTRRSVVKNEYELLADITVSSATTQVDITGLNLVKGEEYVLVADVNSVVTGSIVLFFNANYTATNYWIQRLQVDGTTVSGATANTPVMINAGINFAQAMTKIKLTNSGYIVFQANSLVAYPTTTPLIYDSYGTTTFTATSITSIRIASSNPTGIGIGSRFQLYKVGA